MHFRFNRKAEMVICMCKAVDWEAGLWWADFTFFFSWYGLILFSILNSLTDMWSLAAEGAENGLEFTIVRPFNWIGPRMDFIPGIDGPSEGVPRVLACFSNVCYILPKLLFDFLDNLAEVSNSRWTISVYSFSAESS